MIVLYYNTSSGSCREAIRWFRERGIFISEKRIEYISKSDLMEALTLSNNGFQDLLKNRNITTPSLENKIQEILSLSFDEGVDCILRYPEVLKVPLIVGENKLVLGYNSEEIRVFIPKKHRIQKLSRYITL